jgi:alginate O-acetyltransferase complex protein AlgI
MLGRMAGPHGGLALPLAPVGLWAAVALIAVCHALARSGVWQWLVVRLPAPVIGFGCAVALTLAMLLAPDSSKAFIYFQF